MSIQAGKSGIGRYGIIAVVLSVAAILIAQIFQNHLASQYRAFSKDCSFIRIEVPYVNGKEMAIAITDKRMICGLWELIKKAKSPSHRQKRLYDDSLDLRFISQDGSQATISLVKDRASNEIHLTFYGRRSTLSMSGIDEEHVVEELVQKIAKDNP